MQEQLLHYIWRTRSYDSSNLKSITGEAIQVTYPGSYNTDAGPDFSQASIKIGKIQWSGAVEIHVRSSDWYLHKHENDPTYDNVILHVVWNHDKEVRLTDSSKLPTLVLSSLVDHSLLDTYEILMKEPFDIPCHRHWDKVPSIMSLEMVERVAVERVQKRANECILQNKETNGDWEETTYRLIVSAFGMKVNKEAFKKLAHLIPLKIIRKHQHELTTLEALLYGQAGLLPDDSDDNYITNLLKEHNYLKTKYNLPPKMNRTEWKFNRMRPVNFPTIRMAQLASIFHHHTHFFELVRHASQIDEILPFFRHKTTTYWDTHYDFEKSTEKRLPKSPGKQMHHHLLINVFIPLLAAASKHFDQDSYLERALTWMEALPAEHNKITRKYEVLGCSIENALHSQGLLTLHSDYCLQKRCLSCAIGTSILHK